MLTYTCPICRSYISEADKQWNLAVAFSKCPDCGNALQDFPVQKEVRREQGSSVQIGETDVRATGGSFPWKTVFTWAFVAFLVGLLTIRPPWKNAQAVDRAALGVLAGIVYAVIGGVLAVVVSYWKRNFSGPSRRFSIQPMSGGSVTFNARQVQIIVVAVSLFVLMGICPPWSYTLDYQTTHRERPAGYALIIDPPSLEKSAPAEGIRIDTGRLIVQWIVLTAGTVGALIITRNS